ncbi:FabD/lysophospholipase-like protein [Aulographum hederae CBS 113979]|uniref:FabD/lysophospholipase-like protein n=1 Tax=Aulographum hederae CBS 113979 TaxID=1176131 RepID=A0A6G1GXA3_9PEZI|nr:FabD/lysophospholipase-like protein [Aulographum hederae CBS 113979]
MDSGLRRKDTTKGPPLRILSLDGGGVRGYSIFIQLQELMHRTFVEIEGRAPKREEIPKPCDHFDLIAGTGTGGLIAIMLGRLRMDLETCKDVYVRMTRRVFETDKTIAGIPYRSTLFKASKLEEAIRECVRQHTVSDNEGNDNIDTMLSNDQSPSSPRPTSAYSTSPQIGRTMSSASRYSQIGERPQPVNFRSSFMRWGDPNAPMYDRRENRTKTAVTAIFQGTRGSGSAVLLRSYDSRKETAPEKSCTIWQAGRATTAVGLAFKPIRVGQSVFHDDGAGKFNPSPTILDEAVCNEWPGREVGVFISIGTGKRPSSSGTPQHLWYEGFLGGSLGDFAEARRRLIAKIEGSEDTHQYMLREHLALRNVNPENYYRLNVEVGVGEFGMNEWTRLAEISTNTRMYLASNDVQRMILDSAAKMSRIHRAKLRWERQMNGQPPDLPNRWDRPLTPQVPPPSNPLAVELPANEDVVMSPASHHNYPQQQRPNSEYLSPTYQIHPSSFDEKFTVVSSDEYPQPVDQDHPPRSSSEYPYRRSNDGGFPVSAPHSSNGSEPRYSGERVRITPPPLPPKTPLGGHRPPTNAGATMNRPPGGVGISLPYPDADGPPPVVNMARKPQFGE